MCLVEVRTWSAVLTNLGSRWREDRCAHHFVQFELKLGHEGSFAEPVGLLVNVLGRHIRFFNLLVIVLFISE